MISELDFILKEMREYCTNAGKKSFNNCKSKQKKMRNCLKNSMCRVKSKEKNHDDLICPRAYWPEDAVALEQKGVFIVMKSIQKEQ